MRGLAHLFLLSLAACASPAEPPSLWSEPLARTPGLGLTTYPNVKLRAEDDASRALLSKAASAWDVCGARRALVAADDDADPRIVPVSFVDADDPRLGGKAGATLRFHDAYGGEDYAYAVGIVIRRQDTLDDFLRVALTHEVGHALVSWRSDHWGRGIMQASYATAAHEVSADDCAELASRTGPNE